MIILPLPPSAEPLSTSAILGCVLGVCLDGLRGWAVAWRDLKCVHHLDDRLLADIGFTRRDVRRVVRRGLSTNEIRGGTAVQTVAKPRLAPPQAEAAG